MISSPLASPYEQQSCSPRNRAPASHAAADQRAVNLQSANGYPSSAAECVIFIGATNMVAHPSIVILVTLLQQQTGSELPFSILSVAEGPEKAMVSTVETGSHRMPSRGGLTRLLCELCKTENSLTLRPLCVRPR